MRGSTFRSAGLKIARVLSGETQGTKGLGGLVWTVHTTLTTGTLLTSLPPPSVFFLLPSRATGSPAVRFYAQWASIRFWRRPGIWNGKPSSNNRPHVVSWTADQGVRAQRAGQCTVCVFNTILPFEEPTPVTTSGLHLWSIRLWGVCLGSCQKKKINNKDSQKTTTKPQVLTYCTASPALMRKRLKLFFRTTLRALGSVCVSHSFTTPVTHRTRACVCVGERQEQETLCD